MTENFDRLDKTFNVTSEAEVVEEKIEVVEKKKPDRLTKDDITRDYEYTRGNLYSICLLYTLTLPTILRV